MNQWDKRLRAEATIFGYKLVSFAENWSITLPIPAKTLIRTAAVLGRAEGNINHAISLEARLLRLPKDSRYQVGRSKNGCSTAQVVY